MHVPRLPGVSHVHMHTPIGYREALKAHNHAPCPTDLVLYLWPVGTEYDRQDDG